MKLYSRDPYSFTATRDPGKFLLLSMNDDKLNEESLSQFSKTDYHNYEALSHKFEEILELINPFIDEKPGFRPRLLFEAFKKYRKMSTPISEMYKILTAPIATILDENLESDIFKVTLASDAIIGANQSPYSPNSAYVLLHHDISEVSICPYLATI